MPGLQRGLIGVFLGFYWLLPFPSKHTFGCSEFIRYLNLAINQLSDNDG